MGSANIQTTIAATKNGYCILEQDVTVCVLYDIREASEVTWSVDRYLLSGSRLAFDPVARRNRQLWTDVEAPEVLAKAFDVYLDREWIEEQLVEQLQASGELRGNSCNADHADYHARVL